MFFLQRFLHFHHHDVPDEDPEGCDGHHAACSHEPAGPEAHADAHHDHTLAGKSAQHLSWGGAALGLTLHSLIDGVALAASVEADQGAAGQGILGLGTFLVILLHKPFDALVIGTLMTREGWSRRSRHVVNGLFALAIPVGAALFHLGASQAAASSQPLIGAALAFAAGNFICIAASDLLPELQFHSHDRIKLSCALVAGLIIAAVIGWMESEGHEHHDAAPPVVRSAE
jgi:zinc and cadmium transporter